MPTIFHNFREKIDKKQEEEYACFRFDDLIPEARMKLVKMLKARSTIYTIRDYDESEIYACLDMANPKIIREGWGKGLGAGGDIKRWEEKQLSRIVYYLNRREVGQGQITNIEQNIQTRTRSD